MTKEQYQQKLKEIKQEQELKKQQLTKQFCDANNPYKIGDKFTDHIGTIIIEKISYAHTLAETPCCVYFGTELNKNGTPNKRGDKRIAWQSNDINK